MKLPDLFRRAAKPPVDLLETLMEAASRGDREDLTSLCRLHRQEIRTAFSGWSNVPEPLRKEPAAMRRYCESLIAVAQSFEQDGDSSLIDLLSPRREANPLLAWEAGLVAAQALLDRGDVAGAIGLLQRLLATGSSLIGGSGVEFYLPRTQGLLGIAYFQIGDRERAIEFTGKARAACEASGDREGVETYARNLRCLQQDA